MNACNKSVFRLMLILVVVLLSVASVLSGCESKKQVDKKEETKKEAEEKKEEEEAKYFPAKEPDTAQGKTVYSSNCVACHGAAGKGDGPNAEGLSKKPANFTDTTQMRKRKPSDLYITITNGNEPMPSFRSRLSEDERWSATYYVWSLSADDTKLQDGKNTFTKFCQSCHGANGDGKGPNASGLKKKPPRFMDQKFMSNEAKEDFFKALTEGSEPMPSFKSKLTEEQRWNVIDYLWTFSYK